MITKIIEIIGKIPSKVLGDLGLYVALGGTLVVFLVALVIGLVSSGDLGKFKRCAHAVLKSDTAQNVNANMQRMPIKIKKQYKRAMLTGAKPSDIVSADAAVITPYANSAISKLALATLSGTLFFVAAGVGLSLINTGVFSANEGVIIACGAVLGGLLTMISAAVSSSVYRGALKTYEKFADKLDSVAPSSSQIQTEQPMHDGVYGARTEYAAQTDYTAERQNDVRTEYADQTAYSDGQTEYVRPQFEQTEYEGQTEQAESESRVFEQQPPVYEQPASEEAPPVFVADPPPMESEIDEKTRAKEEAIARLRAEQAERIRQAQGPQNAPDPELEANRAASRAAAQKRLEELKAQREAQLKAQREAQAAANAQAREQGGTDVTASQVIARIENMNGDASLAEMKEVALLLQRERKKPENQTPEQSKKLNEALSKLLKAMSAAQKR